MSGRGKQAAGKVLLACCHGVDAAAAAVLCAVGRGRDALDVIEVGEGIGAILFFNQILNVDFVGHIGNFRAALVAVCIFDLNQFFFDHLKHIAVARQDFHKPGDLAFQLSIFVVDLLLLQAGQAAETHIDDGLRLRVVQMELKMRRTVHNA